MNLNYEVYVQAYDTCSTLRSIKSNSHFPNHLTAIGTVGLGANLKWTPYVGFPIRKYVIQRRLQNAPWQFVDSLPPTDSMYHDSLLLCNTLYAYRVLAYELAGNKQYSFTPVAYAIPSDTTAPLPLPSAS